MEKTWENEGTKTKNETIKVPGKADEICNLIIDGDIWLSGVEDLKYCKISFSSLKGW